MLKKLKNSILAFLLILSTGCVNQNQETSSQMTLALTSVAVAEVFDALEVESEKVVAIPHSDAYTVPKRYQSAVEIGTAMSPDVEQLAQLQPSLIVSPNSLEEDLAKKYEKIGIDSVFLNLKSVAGLYKSIEELGEKLDKKKQAEKLVDEFVDFMQDYRSQHQSQESPKVLILMGLPGSYVVATESSYVGDLVALAGGTNVYGDGNGEDFLDANPEDMLKKDPDIILRTSHALPQQVQQMFENEFKENGIWKQFQAVQKEKVYDLDNEKFGMSANLKWQESLNDLEDILYG